MSSWKEFEEEISNYLKGALLDFNVEVNKFGESNSTRPDIEIKLNNSDRSFYIETKMPKSQTSQFVVEIINNEFVYGKKNRFPSNAFSEEIIDELNKNFNYYKNVKQKPLIIPVSVTAAFGWIVSNMKNKNVEFVMTIDSNNNEKVIPIDKFNELFNVKTILRRKKSGSRVLPKIYYKDFKYLISKRIKESNYIIYENKNRLYIKTSLNLSKEDLYIESEILNDKRYYLSRKDKGIYEIRLTSLTNNPNVIFELSIKNINYDMLTIQSLIDYINKEESNN